MVVMVCTLYSGIVSSIADDFAHTLHGNVTYTLRLFVIVVALKVDKYYSAEILNEKKIIVSIKFFFLNMIIVLLIILINSVLPRE